MHEINYLQLLSIIVTSISALATAGLFVIGLYQLRGIKKQLELYVEQDKSYIEQEKRSNTLTACQRYESDIAIRNSMERIWNKSKNGTDYSSFSKDEQFDVLTLLNYFDGLACGILQGIYIESMIMDNLKTSLEKCVKIFIKGESSNYWRACPPLFMESEFTSLVIIYNKWFLKPIVVFKNSDKSGAHINKS